MCDHHSGAKRIYSETDVGCYADGSFGHDHCRTVLLCEYQGAGGNEVEVIAALKGEMSDDAWEEDAAIEYLQERTEGNCYWGFESGDFGLWEATDDV